ncbi:NAD(P)-binding protein [Stipitochalara longipes BDJ]|nr:NAD(P)-binding protein [Stipitochalara longipes BDJ]
MPSYLITGAGRGLGLAFTAELLKNNDNTVIATARNPASSSGLQELRARSKNGRLILLDLDVSKPESIRSAAEKTAQLLPDGLDHLISSAGVNPNPLTVFDDLDAEQLASELSFTVTAAFLLVREFLPLIRKSKAKKILMLTSNVGSIELAVTMANVGNAYAISRAALNMLARKWSPVLKPDGITIAMVHPGWVGTTEMGSTLVDFVARHGIPLENVPAERSAAGCMKLLNDLTIEDSGSFFNFDGTTIPF